MRKYLSRSIDLVGGAGKRRRAESPLMARVNLFLWLLAAMCFAFAAIVWWRLLH
jgi:hypothetical protein